jgi:hypothetical protein
MPTIRSNDVDEDADGGDELLDVAGMIAVMPSSALVPG